MSRQFFLPAMKTYPNEDWISRSNTETLYHLERQGRTGPGLVPFLGAGISTAYGFKNWRDLLLDAAPPNLISLIRNQLDRNNYEGAAETMLNKLGADGFQNMVAAAAGDTRLDSFDFLEGTVSLLPLLANGPVVTTNFDRVLERAFEANGSAFESVISGPRPDLIVDALHGHRRVLIKLHGDWQDRVGRTFAKSDYNANYGDAQPERKRELLAGAERLLFSSCSLLLIGASLGPDRTVKLLKKVHDEYAGIRHFAIMSLAKTKKSFEETEQHLRTCGVLPLWYKAENSKEHATQVRQLVSTIVERISVQTIKEPETRRPRRRRKVTPTTVPSSPPIPGLAAHFERVVRLIEEGRLTFVLGSAIHHPTNLMAAQFYSNLARIFECEALQEERAAIAQYIADRHGRENLYAEIRKLLARTKFEPRATHQLFASWSDFRTDDDQRVPFPLVVTTNYDNLLECQLEAVKLPFHLLSYQADGPHRGLFYHRSPYNAVRLIERPRNLQSLSDAFVVVKLNGGVRQGHIPESYSTTRLDYWDLAARIPEALPAPVRQQLSANPLLFLGHGLAMPDIEALVRFAHKDHADSRSWAIVLGKNIGMEYWQQLGVEILSADINLYSSELHSRLGRNGPARPASRSRP